MEVHTEDLVGASDGDHGRERQWQSRVTRKGWWEPLLSDGRENQHLFFSILLYLSHIDMAVCVQYMHIYNIYYTHINLYPHTYIFAYVCMYIFLLIMWIFSWWFVFLVGDINRIWSYFWRSLLFAKVRLLILRPLLISLHWQVWSHIERQCSWHTILEAFAVSHKLINVA